MQIELVFNDIIEKLKSEQRPQIKLSSEDHEYLNQALSAILKEANFKDPNLIKILCILDNTISLNTCYKANIIKLLNSCLPYEKEKDCEEVIVLTLGVARKHIIEALHKDAQRIPIDVLDVFKILLSAKSGEIREWTLRNIESLGMQSFYLKEDVINSRPGFLKLFNQHNQACMQIIELLEKRWSVFK